MRLANEQAIFTSLPQPLLAVAVFVLARQREEGWIGGKGTGPTGRRGSYGALETNMFAQHCHFWQSIGRGFTAGSMVAFTCAELLVVP